MNKKNYHADLIDIFDAGLKKVHAGHCIKKTCRLADNILTVSDKRFDLDLYTHIYVTGAGKATAAMALALEEIMGDRIAEGVVSVKYGHTADLKYIEIIEAGHPVPDENGCLAAEKIMTLARKAKENDLFICLISGGGSALMPLPVAGVTLEDKQALTRGLLACGADIHEINSLRKQLSLIKGGGLAAAASPATVITLMISDVVGDDPGTIASGPTVYEQNNGLDISEILQKYNIESKVNPIVYSHLTNGDFKSTNDHEQNEKLLNLVIGNSLEALQGAKKEAERLGYNTTILSSSIEGDTGEAVRLHAAASRSVINSGNPLSRPACILSGGETTVVVSGDGLGGRNTEFALGMALELIHEKGVYFLSAGTDGTDGPTDAAGAMSDSETVMRAKAGGLNPEIFLRNNDSYSFFKALGDLVVTGPTDTNVMDLRVLLLV